MRYAGLIKDDFSAAPGVSVSFYTQGCPHHCPGCHNPETWDYDGGKEFTYEVLDEIIQSLTANGIQRSLCIMGGEPLCQRNEFLTTLVVKTVKEKLPDTKIYIWTGYTYDALLTNGNVHLRSILSQTDYLIDGPYIAAERDTTLLMRGSRNQNIIEIDKSKFL